MRSQPADPVENGLFALDPSFTHEGGILQRSLGAQLEQEQCANYLEKYGVLMDYNVYLGEGLPIFTGVIEGACRHLIKDRTDLTGARWRLKSAEAVLRIRSLRSSGDLDAYWKFHRAQGLKRNYSYAAACAT